MGHLNKRQRQILHIMGIQTWQDRESGWKTPTASAKTQAPPKRTAHTLPSNTQSASIAVLDTGAYPAAEKNAQARLQVIPDATAPDVRQHTWKSLRESVTSCRLCELCTTRTQTVFGVGNQTADWMLVGEAPGPEEDQRGEPFVGRAGQLLDAMMQTVGLDRKTAYITNVLKCRPPGSRDPHVDEMQMCENYLHRQIELVQPKLILAVGRIAAHKLLSSSDSLARLRGKVHHYGAMKIPLIVTFHPAYLLRSPTQKRKVWEDLLLGVDTISGSRT